MEVSKRFAKPSSESESLPPPLANVSPFGSPSAFPPAIYGSTPARPSGVTTISTTPFSAGSNASLMKGKSHCDHSNGYVYVVDFMLHRKIGFSKDSDQRLDAYKTSFPQAKLMCFINGCFCIETQGKRNNLGDIV